MISLDQVRLLEQKVESMLALFGRLKNEKSELEKANTDLKAEIESLQAKCNRFEQDEAKLEQGILSVLNRLNDMEDAVQNVFEPPKPEPVKIEKSVPGKQKNEENKSAFEKTDTSSVQKNTPVSDDKKEAEDVKTSSDFTADGSPAQLDIF